MKEEEEESRLERGRELDEERLKKENSRAPPHQTSSCPAPGEPGKHTPPMTRRSWPAPSPGHHPPETHT